MTKKTLVERLRARRIGGKPDPLSQEAAESIVRLTLAVEQARPYMQRRLDDLNGQLIEAGEEPVLA